jgi:hypothetical protein
MLVEKVNERTIKYNLTNGFTVVSTLEHEEERSYETHDVFNKVGEQVYLSQDDYRLLRTNLEVGLAKIQAM